MGLSAISLSLWHGQKPSNQSNLLGNAWLDSLSLFALLAFTSEMFGRKKFMKFLLVLFVLPPPDSRFVSLPSLLIGGREKRENKKKLFVCLIHLALWAASNWIELEKLVCPMTNGQPAIPQSVKPLQLFCLFPFRFGAFCFPLETKKEEEKRKLVFCSLENWVITMIIMAKNDDEIEWERERGWGKQALLNRASPAHDGNAASSCKISSSFSPHAWITFENDLKMLCLFCSLFVFFFSCLSIFVLEMLPELLALFNDFCNVVWARWNVIFFQTNFRHEHVQTKEEEKAKEKLERQIF